MEKDRANNSLDGYAKRFNWSTEKYFLPDGREGSYYVAEPSDMAEINLPPPLEDFAFVSSGPGPDDSRIIISSTIPAVFREYYAMHEVLCGESEKLLESSGDDSSLRCVVTEGAIVDIIRESRFSDDFIAKFVEYRQRFFSEMADFVADGDTSMARGIRRAHELYSGDKTITC